MSYHIVDISTNGITLSVKDGQLVCKCEDGTMHRLPMEDVGAVLVNSFSASFHSSFIIEAAKRKIAAIICDKFRPVSLVLPVQRSSDTILTRAQIQAPMRTLKALWSMTVDAKCKNQFNFLEEISPGDDKSIKDFKITMSRDDVFKEGNCARLYWAAYSRSLSIVGFKRFRDDYGLNGLLNYGYAVLMLRVEQKLLACGLDPLYGMGHVPRERSLPLAYDIMEPFRPIVDEEIFKWVKSNFDGSTPLAVDQLYKRMIQGIMDLKMPYGRLRALSLDKILEQVIKSYKNALISGKHQNYKPWIRKNSKWDG